MRIFLFIFILFSFITSKSQDYNWWNQKHHWDGVTSWTQYLKYSSKYMGPNALPVPDNIAGKVGDSSFFEFNTAYHYYTGDKTKDIGYNAYFNLVKDFVSFQIYGTFAEHFAMDTITRDERACRYPDLQGSTLGDVNIATIIQLSKGAAWPDLALRVNLRTASGRMVENARYTDGPGYFFDISAGKTINFKTIFIEKIRFKSYAGFYCWQTMLTQQRQNDAYMYSIGVDLLLVKNLKILSELSGYNGSLHLGDRPMIFKSSLHIPIKYGTFYVQYYSGLRDYLYQSVRLGLQYNFHFSKANL